MICRIFSTLILVLLLATSSAWAGKHALLIGIAAYPKLRQLEGPPFDVATLRDELARRWGFPAANVTTLLDGAATRQRILAELDRLRATTRPGDFIFVFYSGHGTSLYDEHLRDYGVELPAWTGALVPYDYGLGLPRRPTPAQVLSQLIVGRRDLRPRLERLDRDRRIFVVFDTCFSGSAVRSIFGNPVRWVSVFPGATRDAFGADEPFGDDDAIFGAATAEEPEYPYRHLIYVSAARRYERADDIPRRRLRELPTVDGQPHGALTNALIEGLRGAANSNHDDRLTYRELYDYVRVRVHERHPHMPRMLFPESAPQLVDDPIFDFRSILPSGSQDGGPVSTRTLLVKLDHQLRHLRARVDGLERVDLVDHGYHVRLTAEDDGLVALYHPSGDRIDGGYHPGSPARLLARLARQVLVQELLDLTLPAQRFNVHLDLSGDSGFLLLGERFDVTVESDVPAYLLLLNVDTTGTVTVLCPIAPSELRTRTFMREKHEVEPPLGTEYLKLFAFRDRPSGLERWIDQKFDVTDPRFEELLRFLRRPHRDGAQTRLKVVTVQGLVRPPDARPPQ